MVFYKNILLKDLSIKYGFPCKGLVAQESIKKGEQLWGRMSNDQSKLTFTRDQLLKIIADHPELEYNVKAFSGMIDNDLYAIPAACLNPNEAAEPAIDPRYFINHSCEPSCGYGRDEVKNVWNMIAIRDITKNEELTFHYGFFETEASFRLGQICKCGSVKCTGKWTFDLYRRYDDEAKYLFTYMRPEMRFKIDEIKEKWFSGKCYLKRIPCDQKPITEWNVTLFSLHSIGKDEIVARYGDQNENHYLRFTEDKPSCYLVGKNVFAKDDLAPDTEITLPLK